MCGFFRSAPFSCFPTNQLLLDVLVLGVRWTRCRDTWWTHQCLAFADAEANFLCPVNQSTGNRSPPLHSEIPANRLHSPLSLSTHSHMCPVPTELDDGDWHSLCLDYADYTGPNSRVLLVNERERDMFGLRVHAVRFWLESPKALALSHLIHSFGKQSKVVKNYKIWLLWVIFGRLFKLCNKYVL